MKVAVITGVSGGIGKAIAEKFIEEGFFVVGSYNNNLSAVLDFKKQLKEKADFFMPVKADFKDAKQVQDFYDTVKSNFKHIDVLINNAGIDLYKLFTETEENEWDDIFNVNLKSHYILTKNVLKDMIEKKYGKIVFISSVFGKCGGSMETAYSASKSALIGLTKALAKEEGTSGINVNCVCPGLIDTAMNNIFSEEEKKEIIENIPIERIGEPKEVAELVYFLSSDKADYITGEVICIDGGFSL